MPIGQAILLRAIEYGDVDAVRKALSRQDVDPGDSSLKKTPLMLAASKGNLAIVQLIIDAGVDVNQRIGGGDEICSETALHIAIQAKAPLAAIETLLDRGAYVDARNSWQMTPLCQAAEKGEVEVGELLLRHGANVNATFSSGMTPLMCAAENGSDRMIEFLVLSGAELEAQHEDSGTALHFAAKNGQMAAINALILLGADQEARDEVDFTPLAVAANRGHVEACLILLAAGSNPQSRDQDQDTPLMLAVHASESIQPLLAYDMGINLQNNNGWTALMKAAVSNNVDVARELLEAGADLLIKNERKKTAADVARECQNHAAFAFFEYWQLSGGGKSTTPSLPSRRRL